MPSFPAKSHEAPIVLAIDVGTSSVRSLLYDARARALPGSERQIKYELTATSDGGAFVDPLELFDLLCRCLDQTAARARDAGQPIAAVGVTSFWHSLIGLDAAGEPATPLLLWADTRAAPEVERLRTHYEQEAVHPETGCVIHSSFWPAKLRWLRRTEPEAFARTARWTGFAEFALRRLTGVDLVSVGMASGTGMLVVARGVWSPLAIEMAGIAASTLPRIADEGELVSGVLPAFRERWPALAETPWLPPLGDGACANVGAGAVGPERVALSLGTSGAMRVVVGAPVGAPLAIPDGLWAYRLDHRRALLGAAISNGGKVMEWLSELLQVELDGDDAKAAAQLPPDGHGLTILPFLAGERSPIWNDRATAVIAGLDLSTGRPELLRAGMEAVALRFARIYAPLAPVAAPAHEIVAGGAGVQSSPVWTQIIADALGHPLLTLPPDEEPSARGAAIMALLAIGAIAEFTAVEDPAANARPVSPNHAHVAIYRRALPRQRALESLLFPNAASWDDAFRA